MPRLVAFRHISAGATRNKSHGEQIQQRLSIIYRLRPHLVIGCSRVINGSGDQRVAMTHGTRLDAVERLASSETRLRTKCLFVFLLFAYFASKRNVCTVYNV